MAEPKNSSQGNVTLALKILCLLALVCIGTGATLLGIGYQSGELLIGIAGSIAGAICGMIATRPSTSPPAPGTETTAVISQTTTPNPVNPADEH